MENITFTKSDRQEIILSIKITFIINTLIAIFISVIVTDSTFITQFLAAQSIGLTIVSIYGIANLLYPKLKSSFKYQYYLLPFPVLIASLIGINFIHQHVDIFELYLLALIVSLPALLVFQFINSKKQANIHLQEEKQKRDLSEKQLLESKLLLLQAQINPHFLFNTLANIDAYIDDSPDQAKSLLQNYSTFLRCSLHTTQSAQGLIKTEVDLINAYMHIQQTRFPNIQFNQEISPDLLNTPIPPLLIQPVIENALIHGLAPQGNQGIINLSIMKKLNNLCIKVSDDGVGINNEKENNNGIALKNIESRIQLYNHKSTFKLAKNTSGGVDAEIIIPL